MHFDFMGKRASGSRLWRRTANIPTHPGCKNPYTGAELSIIRGHEISGNIVEIGSSITGFKVGQGVVINPLLDERYHGKESRSIWKAGIQNLCRSWAIHGLNAHGGGFADEIVVKQFSCIPLPKCM